MDNKKEYIQTEKDISLDNDPFIKIGCIIGVTYSIILLISYIILIHILKIYSLKPIFYIAIYIGIILLLLYTFYVVSTISLNIVEETTEKPKKEEAKKEQIDKKQSG